MKIRIREGNDFDVVWAIKRAGVPEDLSTAINMKLTLVVYGLVIEHDLFTVTDNLLSINIPKEVATVNGDYRLIFEYILPDAGQPDGDLKCKTDVVPFRIVPFTAKADDIYTINVTSDIAFGFKGDKGDDGDDAYQIWLDLGNEGTYEDFIAYLRQPAVDAGASISELEGEIQVSEELRIQAESERDLAEATRVQAENERLSAETIRQSNEGNRIEDEVTRVQNEAERISEEGIRQSSEVDRVEAEGIRQSNEIDRIEAEGVREQAEVERQNTIQEAVTATNLANEKANLANTAAQSANEAAGLADTARTELTTAVNTKLGEADAKIEEMDTTLSTYDGRVTQVESDITQLAGDVKETAEKPTAQSMSELNARITALEAILSSKIKDRIDVTKQFNVWGKTNLILYGDGANTKAPDFIGQKYIDTTNSNVYVAVGNSNAGNWKLV